jgi:hypothetical protein
MSLTKEMIRIEIEGFVNTLNSKFPTHQYSVEFGKKFAKVLNNSSVWGFISMIDDNNYKGSPIQVFDLMKAAAHNIPAKTARGNIKLGTAMYDWTGPVYMNKVNKATIVTPINPVNTIETVVTNKQLTNIQKIINML